MVHCLIQKYLFFYHIWPFLFSLRAALSCKSRFVRQYTAASIISVATTRVGTILNHVFDWPPHFVEIVATFLLKPCFTCCQSHRMIRILILMLIFPMTFDVASFLRDRCNGESGIEVYGAGEDGVDEKEKDPKAYKRLSFVIALSSYNFEAKKMPFPQVCMSISEWHCAPLDMPPECAHRGRFLGC